MASSLAQPSDDQIQALLRALGLPKATDIKPLSSSTGEYHSIYFLDFPATTDFGIPDAIRKSKKPRLVLRVSLESLPQIKTMNEMSCMTWVRQNTEIPVPAVIAFDSGCDNALGYEFSLVEHVEGTLLSETWRYRSDVELDAIIDQVINHVLQLYKKPLDSVGGLVTNNEGVIEMGPIIEWYFWKSTETDCFSNPLSKNIRGPFDSFASYCTAQLQAHKAIIASHESLLFLRQVPSTKLLQYIELNRERVNQTRYVLAHRDLHFGNILYDASTNRITAIIDWELAAVLPYQLWNPGNFLWTGEHTSDARKTQSMLVKRFEKMCRERQLEFLLDDAKFMCEEQKVMQEATVMLRWAVVYAIREKDVKTAQKFASDFVDLVDSLAV